MLGDRLLVRKENGLPNMQYASWKYRKGCRPTESGTGVDAIKWVYPNRDNKAAFVIEDPAVVIWKTDPEKYANVSIQDLRENYCLCYSGKNKCQEDIRMASLYLGRSLG